MYHFPATRWRTTLSSKANLQHAIDFKASCGAKLVTQRSNFPANEALEFHCLGGPPQPSTRFKP